jgi:hypothetical protein
MTAAPEPFDIDHVDARLRGRRLLPRFGLAFLLGLTASEAAARLHETYDALANVLRRTTYNSHYSRITGVTLVGRASAPDVPN